MSSTRVAVVAVAATIALMLARETRRRRRRHAAGTSAALRSWDAPLVTASGTPVPELAFGLGTRHRYATTDVTAASLRAALRAGYRHLDCARFYGTEEVAGRVLAEGLVPRAELFITSKIWMTHHDAAGVRECAAASLQSLGLEYLDLLLVHWPVAWARDATPEQVVLNPSVGLSETWRALEGLVEAGAVRALGVSNCDAAELDKILAVARVARPIVNQVECHPHCPQRALLAACVARGVKLMCYGPLWPLRAASEGGPPDGLGVSRVAADIAAAHPGDKPAAQVLLRWHVERGCLPITTSSKPERIREHAEIFEFSLTEAEVTALDRAGAEAPSRRYNPVGWRDPLDAPWFAPESDTSENDL